jgi:ribosomal protein S8
MSNSLSHLFSHIQNGQRNRILVIESVQTKLIIAILNILQDHGYIRGYRFHPNASNKLQILLKYKNQKPVINKIICISKPSKRVYMSINQLRESQSESNQNQIKFKGSLRPASLQVHNGGGVYSARSVSSGHQLTSHFFMQGIFILSTSKGI